MSSLNAGYLSAEELAGLGFGDIGDDVQIHRTVVIVDCANVSIGCRVRIDPFCVLSAGGGIAIGNNVHLAAAVSISGPEQVIIEDFCGLSARAIILTGNDDYSGNALLGPTVPTAFRAVARGPVILRRHVQIGAASVVLPNCTVGIGSAVGALSLVKASLGDWGIYAGVPATRMRDRNKAILARERDYASCLPTTEHGS